MASMAMLNNQRVYSTTFHTIFQPLSLPFFFTDRGFWRTGPIPRVTLAHRHTWILRLWRVQVQGQALEVDAQLPHFLMAGWLRNKFY